MDEILENDSSSAAATSSGSTSFLKRLFSKKKMNSQAASTIVAEVKETIVKTQSASVTITQSKPKDQNDHADSDDEKKPQDNKLTAVQSARYLIEAPDVVKSTFIKKVSDDGKRLNIAVGKLKLLSNNPKQKAQKTQVLASGLQIPADGYLIDAENIIRAFFESQDKNKIFYIRKPNNNKVDPLRVEAMLLVAKAMGLKAGKNYVNQSGVALRYQPTTEAVEHTTRLLKLNQKVDKDLLDSLAAQLEPIKNVGIAGEVIKKIKSNQTPTLQELDDVQHAIEKSKPKMK